jgi:hypothetical protein
MITEIIPPIKIPYSIVTYIFDGSHHIDLIILSYPSTVLLLIFFPQYTTMTRPFKPPPLARDTTGFRCNSLRAYAWKQWTMFEATFAICGLEPWEKLVFGEYCTLDLEPLLTVMDIQ